MEGRRPFASEEELLCVADEVWGSLSERDWREAFAAHPRIGSRHDVGELSPEARAWAEREQAGAAAASRATREALADANAAYERRFGYLFIVCATGKTADEMLSLCRARLDGSPEHELRVAADEQRKITRLRLEKLLREEGAS
jgi:OHCU decarboxylase